MQVIGAVRAASILALLCFAMPSSVAHAFSWGNFLCDSDDKLTREVAAKYLQSMSKIYLGLSQLELKDVGSAKEQFSTASKDLAAVTGLLESLLKSSCFKSELELNYKVMSPTDIKFLVLTFEHFKLQLDPKEMIPAAKLGLSSEASVPRTLRIAVVAILRATAVVVNDLSTYQKMGTPQKPKDVEPLIASTALLTRYGHLVSKMAEKT